MSTNSNEKKELFLHIVSKIIVSATAEKGFCGCKTMPTL
jgi:hypothetical protein